MKRLLVGVLVPQKRLGASTSKSTGENTGGDVRTSKGWWCNKGKYWEHVTWPHEQYKRASLRARSQKCWAVLGSTARRGKKLLLHRRSQGKRLIIVLLFCCRCCTRLKVTICIILFYHSRCCFTRLKVTICSLFFFIIAAATRDSR